MAKLQFWHGSLREFLTSNYEYDMDSGLVSRKRDLYGERKSEKPIGSTSASGDKVVVALFEEKQWMIRVVKLAVFLMTGEQHQRFSFRDGDKMNTIWENIVIEDEACNSEEEWESKRKARADKAIQEANERRSRVTAYVELLSEQPSPVLITKQKVVKEELTPVQVERAKKKELKALEDEKQRKSLADFYAKCPSGEVSYDWANRQATRYQAEIKQLQDRYEKEYGHLKYISGLCTNMSIEKIREFFADVCKNYVNIENKVAWAMEFEKKHPLESRATTASKVENDIYTVCCWLNWIEKGDLNERNVEYMSRDYTWNGKPVKEIYGRLPEHIEKQFALEEHGLMEMDRARCDAEMALASQAAQTEREQPTLQSLPAEQSPQQAQEAQPMESGKEGTPGELVEDEETGGRSTPTLDASTPGLLTSSQSSTPTLLPDLRSSAFTEEEGELKAKIELAAAQPEVEPIASYLFMD